MAIDTKPNYDLLNTLCILDCNRNGVRVRMIYAPTVYNEIRGFSWGSCNTWFKVKNQAPEIHIKHSAEEGI